MMPVDLLKNIFALQVKGEKDGRFCCMFLFNAIFAVCIGIIGVLHMVHVEYSKEGGFRAGLQPAYADSVI